MSAGAPPVLVLRHVEWEGPHRIAAALRRRGLELVERRPLRGDELPRPEALAAAVIMGGPMNVDDPLYPGLAAERAWIGRALAAGLPLLGVCLGAQLIARALGATVRRGPRPEIGWGPVRVTAPDDPLVGALAPQATVLHWHGDIFDAPPGARALAESDASPCQAFRSGDAWGLLFHAEADAALVDAWLAEPAMRAEAADALGPDAPAALRAGAAAHGPALTRSTAAGFAHLADLAATRAG